MRLFIAEKPSVAKAIAAELGITGRGEGYIDCGASRVTWCFGHMLEQAEPDAYLSADVPASVVTGKKLWRSEDLPIIPKDWQLRPRADAKAQLAVIGRLLKGASEIVHAGDPDREGQLLVDEVLEHFGCRLPVQRFWVSAQDAVSVQRGLQSLRDNAQFAGFGAAAQQRSRADWLIGMNLSRAYTLRARRGGSQALLTIGRVQTPTLGLVVARDREIEGFKPKAFHTLTAQIQHANGSFRAAWRPTEDQAGLDAEGRLIDTEVAIALGHAVVGRAGTVASYEQSTQQEAHPKALALSDVTLLASNRFGYSAETVLKVCQSLYETHKLTSYPRTDCGYLPESQHADAPRILSALRKVHPELGPQIDGADPHIRSATWNDKKITAHHGIIPTLHEGSVNALTVEARQIYQLIVRAYLAQFYPLHEYLGTKVEVRVAEDTFAAAGRVVTQVGWKTLYAGEAVVHENEAKGAAAHDELDDDAQHLPAMRRGDRAACVRLDRKDVTTKPPARFTEGTLGKAMENIHRFVTDPAHRKMLREGDGIGTSATRASIVSELRRRNFLEAKGKYICSTALGRSLIDALPEVVRNPLLTAIYERMLKDIELGQGDPQAFLAKQEHFIRDQVARANDGAVTMAGAGAVPCPQCGKTLRRIQGANGFFWSCIDRDACKHTMPDKAGKPVAKMQAAVSAVHQCQGCGHGLVQRTAPKKPREKVARRWWGCSGFPTCKQAYGDADGQPDYGSGKAAA
ncbi:DNA topoisomerase III [Variovorax sp. RHLX14]|uniref:DNA topoisomerase III n=1 Tax=Variovorax sp. RHLX14 TaxID=1259731 RepID=UPI003F44B210